MQWLIYFGIKETSKNELFRSVGTGDIIFDVGANVGEYTLNFARSVGSTGKIFSFEPHPLVFKKLQHHIQINRMNHIKYYNMGLSDAPGKLHMSICETRNSGGRSVSKNNQKENKGESTQVEVVQLDSIMEQENLSHIDLIKIDVEGHELRVLKGAEKLIVKYKPNLYIEVNNSNLQNHGDSSATLFQWLKSKGYSIYDAIDLRPIHSVGDFAPHMDIICNHDA